MTAQLLQLQPGATQTVVVDTEVDASATVVSVHAPRGGVGISLADLLPIFNSLGAYIVSYSKENDEQFARTTDQSAPAASSVLGRFLVTDFQGRKLTDKQVLLRLSEHLTDVVRQNCQALISSSRTAMDVDQPCSAIERPSSSLPFKAQAAAVLPPAYTASPFASPFAAISPSPRPRVTDDLDQPDSGRDKRSRRESDEGVHSSAWQQLPAPHTTPAAQASAFAGCWQQPDEQHPSPIQMDTTMSWATSDLTNATSNRSSGLLPLHDAQSPLPALASDDLHLHRAASIPQASLHITTPATPSTAPAAPLSSSRQQSMLLDDDDDCWVRSSSTCTAGQIMSPLHCVSQDSDLGQARAVMAQRGVRALLVDTGDAQPGFISERDFLRCSQHKHWRRTKVRDVMAKPVICVDVDAKLQECAETLQRRSISWVVVRDPAAATPSCPLRAYVGLVSDAEIFLRMDGDCCGGGGLRSPCKEPAAGAAAAVQEARQPLAAASETSGRQQSDAARSDRTITLLPPPAARRLELPQQQQQQQQQPLQQQLQKAGSACSHASTASNVSGATMTSVPSHHASEGNYNFSDKFSAAAALWELDFNEIELQRRIGEGSFGEVLLGSFRGTKVAVKRLRCFDDRCPDDGDDGGPLPAGCSRAVVFRQFFEREIEILASIRHPNVVNFIGACHTPPNVCLVTEYCARGSLDHLLHRSTMAIDLVKKVEFAIDVARGMSCLHAQRPAIIHRDLKPANLLVSARLEVKVADFGLSRIKDHAQVTNTRAGLEGTIEYCAPEVLRGEPYTEKCDVWSYGVVLWEMLLRRRPYAELEMPPFLMMMSLGTGQLVLEPVPEEAATPALAELVARCLSREPACRPGFREVLALLEVEYRGIRARMAAGARRDSTGSGYPTPGVSPRVALDEPQQQQLQQQEVAAGSHPASLAGSPALGHHPAWRLSSSPRPPTPHHLDHYQQQLVGSPSPSGAIGSRQGSGVSAAAQQQHPVSARGDGARPSRPRRMSRARSMPAPASSQWVGPEGETVEEEEQLAMAAAAEQYYQQQQLQKQLQYQLYKQQAGSPRRCGSPQLPAAAQRQQTLAAAAMAHRPPSRLATVSGDGASPPAAPQRQDSQQAVGSPGQYWLHTTPAPAAAAAAASSPPARHYPRQDSPRLLPPAAAAALADHNLLRSSLERVHAHTCAAQQPSPGSTPRKPAPQLSPFAAQVSQQASLELPMASPDSGTSHMIDAQLCSVIGSRTSTPGTSQQQSAGVHSSQDLGEELAAAQLLLLGGSPAVAAPPAAAYPAYGSGSGHLLLQHQPRPASRLSTSSSSAAQQHLGYQVQQQQHGSSPLADPQHQRSSSTSSQLQAAFAALALEAVRASPPAAHSPFAAAAVQEHQQQQSPFASATQQLGFHAPPAAAPSALASPFAQLQSPFAAAQQPQAAAEERGEGVAIQPPSRRSYSDLSAALAARSSPAAAYSPFAAAAMTRFDSVEAPGKQQQQQQQQHVLEVDCRQQPSSVLAAAAVVVVRSRLAPAASSCSAASLDKSTSGASEPEMFQLDVHDRA